MADRRESRRLTNAVGTRRPFPDVAPAGDRARRRYASTRSGHPQGRRHAPRRPRAGRDRSFRSAEASGPLKSKNWKPCCMLSSPGVCACHASPPQTTVSPKRFVTRRRGCTARSCGERVPVQTHAGLGLQARRQWDALLQPCANLRSGRVHVDGARIVDQPAPRVGSHGRFHGEQRAAHEPRIPQMTHFDAGVEGMIGRPRERRAPGARRHPRRAPVDRTGPSASGPEPSLTLSLPVPVFQ